jgi:hypothetical protein
MPDRLNGVGIYTSRNYELSLYLELINKYLNYKSEIFLASECSLRIE